MTALCACGHPWNVHIDGAACDGAQYCDCPRFVRASRSCLTCGGPLLDAEAITCGTCREQPIRVKHLFAAAVIVVFVVLATWACPHSARADQEREASQPEVSAREGAIHTPDLVARTRDKAGKLTRSQARRRAFMKATGFPNGRPGYVVDHLVPLACGGADVPSNYSWQTTAEGKAKDAWELDCRRWSDGSYLRLLQRALEAEKAAGAKRRADIQRNRKR